MRNVTKTMPEFISSLSRICSLLCAIVLLSMLGCGQSGRVSVEGTVTLDGQPLKNAQIQFHPLPGTAGPTAGADIVDGKFAIPTSGGPFVGKFEVQIIKLGLTGKKVFDPRSNSMIDEYIQILPTRYNAKSELEAEVAASGPNSFEFTLTSK